MAWHYLVTDRTGFGNNYASGSNQNQIDNATEIYYYLTARGWSLSAICGVLGNFQYESYLNPAQYELNQGYSTRFGYGLGQWTPTTNYTNWANARGYDITDGARQLEWVDEYTIPFGQWIPTSSFNVSFANYKTTTNSPEWAAECWERCWERGTWSDIRSTSARWWYEYFQGEPPPPPPPPPGEHFPIWLLFKIYANNMRGGYPL